MNNNKMNFLNMGFFSSFFISENKAPGLFQSASGVQIKVHRGTIESTFDNIFSKYVKVVECIMAWIIGCGDVQTHQRSLGTCGKQGTWFSVFCHPGPPVCSMSNFSHHPSCCRCHVCTVQSTLHTLYCTVHCTLCTVMYTVYCTVPIACYILDSAYSVLYAYQNEARDIQS